MPRKQDYPELTLLSVARGAALCPFGADGENRQYLRSGTGETSSIPQLLFAT